MKHLLWFSAAAVSVSLVSPIARADQVTINPSADTTLIEFGSGFWANGKGEFFFCGKTNEGYRRRALILFDVASAVPAGSTITAVSLQVRCSKTTAGTHTSTLHRMLESWSEGVTNAGGSEGGGAPAVIGDTTWHHRTYNTVFWGTPGGVFTGASSGSAAIGGANVVYTFSSTPGMVADVQFWLDNPGQNFGWMLRGNEGPDHTAKRFDSRDNPVVNDRPKLTITYTPPPPPSCDGDADGDGDTDSTDLNIVLTAFGCSGGGCAGDLDGDSDTDSTDLNIVLTDFGCD